MPMTICFSGECGLCTGCSGKVGTKEVCYMTPQELCKDITGEDAPPPEIVKDTYKLYLEMLQTSEEYHSSKPIRMWGKLARGLSFSERFFRKGDIHIEIQQSHVEFLKGCTEENKVYGEKRCLKPCPDHINDLFYMGYVNPKKVYGKVLCAGGGYYDLDAKRRQAILKSEDYEKYFDKFSDYLVNVNEEMKKYGAVLGGYKRLGNIPMTFTVDGEEYTFTDDERVCCDNVECSLMAHCMMNWDTPPGNYTGEKKPRHNTFYYCELISQVPKYTKNMKHELCLICVKDAAK